MDSEGMNPDYDPGSLTFSQAQGYEELTGPLQLEELPKETRTHIWNVFYSLICETGIPGYSSVVDECFEVLGEDWEAIFYEKHIWVDDLPVENWNRSLYNHITETRKSIETLPCNKVFDLIQFVMRHPSCPNGFIDDIKEVFARKGLAYVIDDGPPPTIVPSVTVEEGKTILESMQTLRDAGLGASASHLRRAAECINGQDWAGSVRESIHAVESVARQLDPKASNTLGPALKSLEKERHPPSGAEGGIHQTLRVHVGRTGHSACAFGPRSAQTWVWTRRCSCWGHALPSPAIYGGSTWRGRNDGLARVVGG